MIKTFKNTQILQTMKEDVRLVQMKFKMNITFYLNVRREFLNQMESIEPDLKNKQSKEKV